MTDKFSSYGDSPFREEPQDNNRNVPPSRENGEGNPLYESPRNDGYPYGNPYSFGRYPGGSPYEKKPSLLERLKRFFTEDKVWDLFILSSAAAAAIIFFDVVHSVFALILRYNDEFRALYLENHTATMIFGMLYTLLSVAVPFFLAYILLKVLADIELPFSAPRRKSGAMLLIPAGLGICYMGNIVVSYMMTLLSYIGINSDFYEATLTQTEPLPENISEVILSVIYVAVFPAVFEEFAFRGVIMQPLRRYGDWFAIIASAVLFGFVHGNIVQIPFAIIAGVALGYATTVTGSMWTGIIIHFLNNFMSVIFSWAKTALPDSTNMIFSAIFTYGIILIGIVALVGFAWQNPRMMRLYPSRENIKNSRAIAVYFLAPAMLAALIMISINIFSDISVG